MSETVQATGGSAALGEEHHSWIESFCGASSRPSEAAASSPAPAAAAAPAPAPAKEEEGGFFSSISHAVSGAVSAVGDAASSVVHGAVDVAEGAVSAVTSVADKAIHVVADTVATVETAVVDAVPLPDSIKSVAHDVIDFQKGVVEGAADGAKGLVDGVAHLAGSVTKEGYDLATSEKAREEAAATVVHGAEAVGGFVQEAVTDPGKAWDDTKGAVEGAAKKVLQIGRAVYHSYEEAQAAGHGAEWMGKAVGQVGVAVAGAVLTDGASLAGEGAVVGAEVVTEGAAVLEEGGVLLEEAAALAKGGRSLEEAAALAKGGRSVEEAAALAKGGRSVEETAALAKGGRSVEEAEELAKGGQTLEDGAQAGKVRARTVKGVRAAEDGANAGGRGAQGTRAAAESEEELVEAEQAQGGARAAERGRGEPPSRGGGGDAPPSRGGGGDAPPSRGGGGNEPPSRGGGGDDAPPSGGGDEPPSGGGGGRPPPKAPKKWLEWPPPEDATVTGPPVESVPKNWPGAPAELQPKVAANWDKAAGPSKKLMEKAIESEPAMTESVQGATEAQGGKMIGLPYRLKGAKSLTQKVAADMAEFGTDADQAAGGVSDAVRYTSAFPPDKLAEGAMSTIEKLEAKGNKLVELKNGWLKTDKSYRGVNVKMLGPDGQPFELQFHTPESFWAKDEGTHKLYEEMRTLDKGSARYKELDAQQMEIANSLEIPKGIEKLKPVTKAE